MTFSHTIDTITTSMQKGAYLLKPGSKKGGCKQRDDGLVVDSSGKVIPPGKCGHCNPVILKLIRLDRSSPEQDI